MNEERNKQIYQDRENGMSFTEISKKYNMSYSMIKPIYEKTRRKIYIKKVLSGDIEAPESKIEEVKLEEFLEFDSRTINCIFRYTNIRSIKELLYRYEIDPINIQNTRLLGRIGFSHIEKCINNYRIKNGEIQTESDDTPVIENPIETKENIIKSLNNCISRINNQDNIEVTIKDLISELSNITNHNIGKEIDEQIILNYMANNKFTLNQICSKYNISIERVNKIYKKYQSIQNAEDVLADPNSNKFNIEKAELFKFLKYNRQLLSSIYRGCRVNANYINIRYILKLYMNNTESELALILRIGRGECKFLIDCIKEYEQNNGSIIMEIKNNNKLIDIKLEKNKIKKLFGAFPQIAIEIYANNIYSIDDLLKINNSDIRKIFDQCVHGTQLAIYTIARINKYKNSL